VVVVVFWREGLLRRLRRLLVVGALDLVLDWVERDIFALLRYSNYWIFPSSRSMRQHKGQKELVVEEISFPSETFLFMLSSAFCRAYDERNTSADAVDDGDLGIIAA
jgi:hypothetical protein